MRYEIADKISYIPSQDSPLSADVAIINGNRTYLFDVGSSDIAYEEISNIEGDKCAIISHFHPDHIGNLSRLLSLPIYVSANTFKYASRGTVIEEETQRGLRFSLSHQVTRKALWDLLLITNMSLLGTLWLPQ